LAWCVERLRAAARIDEVWVATSVSPGDDAVVELGKQRGFSVFRGSEDDVLSRFVGAVDAAGFDHVLRICGDSPFVDPSLVDELIEAYMEADVDYASNVGQRSYPRGLDAEVFRADKLRQVAAEATAPYARAHVTPNFYQNPDRYRLLSVGSPEDYSAYRWCVDEPTDLAMVRALAARLGRRDFNWREALAVVEAEPELAAINAAVEQKKLEQG